MSYILYLTWFPHFWSLSPNCRGHKRKSPKTSSSSLTLVSLSQLRGGVDQVPCRVSNFPQVVRSSFNVLTKFGQSNCIWGVSALNLRLVMNKNHDVSRFLSIYSFVKAEKMTITMGQNLDLGLSVPGDH